MMRPAPRSTTSTSAKRITPRAVPPCFVASTLRTFQQFQWHALELHRDVAGDETTAADRIARLNAFRVAVQQCCPSAKWKAQVQCVNLSPEELQDRAGHDMKRQHRGLPIVPCARGAIISELLRYAIELISFPREPDQVDMQIDLGKLVGKIRSGAHRRSDGAFLAIFDSWNHLKEDKPYEGLPWAPLDECVSDFGMRSEHRAVIAQTLKEHSALWVMWCVLRVRHVDHGPTADVQPELLQYAVPVLFTEAGADCSCSRDQPR
jgi:hypothetical protein